MSMLVLERKAAALEGLVGVLFLALALGGCKKKDEWREREINERISRLESKLAPAELTTQFDFWARSPEEKIAALSFPIQKTTAKCKGDTIRVVYNPYRDLVRIGFADENAIDEELRALSINGASVWTKKEPFTGQQIIGTWIGADGKATKEPVEQRTRSVTIDKLVEERSKLFPPDTDVTFDVSGNSMASKDLPDRKFTYVPHSYRGWRVKLHVFSAQMAKDLLEHVERLNRAGAELQVLGWYTSDIDSLRTAESEKAKEMVKRYDDLLAAAKQKEAAVGAMPHAKYVSALSVEHVPACP